MCEARGQQVGGSLHEALCAAILLMWKARKGLGITHSKVAPGLQLTDPALQFCSTAVWLFENLLRRIRGFAGRPLAWRMRLHSCTRNSKCDSGVQLSYFSLGGP